MNHAVLEDALPFVLHPRHLTRSPSDLTTKERQHIKTPHLVVRAEHDVGIRRTTFNTFLLVLRIGIVQVAVDGFRVIGLTCRRVLRWLR